MILFHILLLTIVNNSIYFTFKQKSMTWIDSPFYILPNTTSTDSYIKSIWYSIARGYIYWQIRRRLRRRSSAFDSIWSARIFVVLHKLNWFSINASLNIELIPLEEHHTHTHSHTHIGCGIWLKYVHLAAILQKEWHHASKASRSVSSFTTTTLNWLTSQRRRRRRLTATPYTLATSNASFTRFYIFKYGLTE